VASGSTAPRWREAIGGGLELAAVRRRIGASLHASARVEPCSMVHIGLVATRGWFQVVGSACIVAAVQLFARDHRRRSCIRIVSN
jgi:hypothetical protein